MATTLRHPRPGLTWDWWAVDAGDFLVQFSNGPAPEPLLHHLDRVDAAAAWAQTHCPTWFRPTTPPVHAFECHGELPTYVRTAVPDRPGRLQEAPAVIAEVAALVVLDKEVKDTWTVYLDEGWL